MAAASSSVTGRMSGPRPGRRPYSTTNTFDYHRNDDRFEQVMAYYWVTEAQKYIQSLGFGSTRRAVNKESQDIRTNQYGVDNSFSWDKHDYLRFGKGGVDDAEDAEVILHEYGHAIQDSQVAGFGVGPEAGGIGEGFGDYWAVTVSDVIAPTPTRLASRTGTPFRTRPTVPHCLRRVDTDAHYPRGPRRRGPSQRPDLVARPVGHPPGARARPRGHADPRGAVRVRSRHDDAGRGRGDRCRRADACTAAGSRRPSKPPSWPAGSSNRSLGRRRDRRRPTLPGRRRPVSGSSAIVGA